MNETSLASVMIFKTKKPEYDRARCVAPRVWFSVLSRLLISFCAMGWIALTSLRAENSAHPDNQGWSADLLERLISVPDASEVGSNGGHDGWIMRSYQLRSLKIGEAGRATNLVNILKRMLPPESRLTEDRAGNTLHLFSTTAAQEGALELISAMDSEEAFPNTHAEPSEIPEDVRKALQALAASRPDAEKMSKLVTDAETQMEKRVGDLLRQAEIDSQSRTRSGALNAAAILGAILIAGAGGMLVYMKREQRREILAAAKRETSSLAVLPTQGMELILTASREQQDRAKELQRLMESFSIAYQADRQRTSLVMEAVGKRQGELAATVEQMQQLRREIGENAGRLFLDVNRDAIDHIVQRASDALKARAEEVGLIAETASRKMEETATRLEVQHAKAEALAMELERTQKEVDVLFEKLRSAQEEARKAENEAHEQRQIATEKAMELAKKEAALAGLSLLMQEPMPEILDTLDSSHQPPPEGFEDPCTPNVIDFSVSADLAAPDSNPTENCPPSENVGDNPSPSCTNPAPYHFRISAVS